MPQQLVIACVKAGKIYHSCYANILYDMVRRNLSPHINFTFICFTDDPRELDPHITAHPLPADTKGWWNKLYMFKSGIFNSGQRIIYFDLDTLITGNLDFMAAYTGEFAILKDFYRDWGYGSGVMMWQGGTLHHIWETFDKGGKINYHGGDQAWIEMYQHNADLLQQIFPGKFCSYKTECNPLPAENIAVVCFHGEPKQDNCPLEWVKNLWQIGAPPGLDRNRTYPTIAEQEAENIQHALSLKHQWLEEILAHARQIVLVGGGPSLDNCVAEIKQHRAAGHTIIAINNSWKWLRQHEIEFDEHVIFNADSAPASAAKAYIAATCPPEIFTRAGDITIFNPAADGLLSMASTAGLKALAIAFTTGARNIHLYGFDSCYDDLRRHHAYQQPRNDKDRVFARRIYERDFYIALWMMTQAEDFVRMAEKLIAANCQISVYGEGLIPFVAAEMTQLYLAPRK